MPIALVIGMTAVSCQDPNEDLGGITGKATISGMVKDTEGQAVAGVSVSTNKSDVKATTGADGSYTLADVPAVTQMIKFEKSGYGTAAVTIPESRLAGGSANVDAVLEFAQAVISGKVFDAMNNNAPVEGATVTLNGVKTTTTDASGAYIFEGLTIQDYDLVIFKSGIGQATVKLTKDMFDADGVIEVEDIALSLEILPGLSLTQLKNCQPWYGNEFRGGKGNGGGVVDWSTVFMSAAFTPYPSSKVENQNEGYTLQIRNDAEDQKNPGNLEQFDTYFYGRKLITADNCVMTIYCRTHQSPAYWSVMVVDLSAAEPAAVRLGDIHEYSSGDNKEFEYDLSDYIGKEIIISIGHYRHDTGDYWRQFVIRKVSFAKEKCLGDSYLPGTEVVGLEGWHMTQEMVRSTMAQELNSFSGIPSTGNEETPLEPTGWWGYRRWNGTNHILANWSLMFISKDMEPVVGEGFVIKTTIGKPADYNVPESYFYAKFDIKAGHNTFDLKCRNFDGSKATTFRFTVIDEDGNAVAMSPVSNTAAKASAVENGNGCWQFIHENGGPGAPDDYATFTYDLSSYDGKSVIVAIGVHKGEVENNDGEQKLCVYGVDIR